MNDICGLIDNDLAGLIHTIITLLKIGVPIVLIIFGMLDFGKAIIAKKDDEFAASRKVFINRLISAFFVFFVVTIVQFMINLVDDNNGTSGIWDCANLILNGEPSESEKTSKEEQKRLDCCIKAGGEKVLDREDWSCKLNNSEVSEATKKYRDCVNNNK